MLVRVDLTKTDINKIIKNMVVIYAKNEQENKHIIDELDKMKIKHRAKTLTTCDYSFELDAMPEYGIMQPLNFENICLIERKDHLTELAGNFSKDRTRFENEFIRSKTCKHVILMIENGSYEDILSHKYRTELGEDAFYNTLLSWSFKYNIKIDFVKKEFSARHIVRTFQTILKKYLES